MSDTIRIAVTAGSFLAGSILLAFLARWIMRSVLGRLYRRTASNLDDLLFRGLETPLMLFIVAVGAYACALEAFRLPIWKLTPEQLAAYASSAGKVFRAVATFVVAYGVLRLVNVASRWYARNAAPTGAAHQVDLLKKLVNIAAWSLVVVLVLGQLGYKISALLAGLGIGGLAVALALQDTLSNMFAGFYVMADKTVRVGDYVKLDSGEEGFVEEVGWRNTRIRLWANNMVLVPNSRLVQSILTNYDMPQQQMSVYVPCGVSYDSDLDRVEEVTVDVARSVQQAVEGAVDDHEPVVRFKEFGDSNINFIVVLRAKDVSGQYLLHHEFVKALHRRYREEGIEISYPVRVIVPTGENSKHEA